MATYREIQEYVRNKCGYIPKTCWIAHMKELCGLSTRVSPNRYSLDNRTHPCPPNKQVDIRNAFIHFKML